MDIFPYYDVITKNDDVISENADNCRKKYVFIIFCLEPVKEIPNLYQGKFGAPGPKNAKMEKGGPIRHPPVYNSLQKARVM